MKLTLRISHNELSDRELVHRLNHKMPLVQFPEQIESNGKHDIGAYKRTYITRDVKRSDYPPLTSSSLRLNPLMKKIFTIARERWDY